MKIDVEQELKDLGPKIIDPDNCTPKLSLYQQILNTPKAKSKILKEQAEQWFNLGNNQTFNDPISAAQYLLQREYGDSSIFKADCHKPVFIPSEIACSEYEKGSSLAVLDYDIEVKIKQTFDNLKQESPEYWFTKELASFLQTQAANNEIRQGEFDKWIVNVMVLQVMKSEFPTVHFQLPPTTSSNFVKESIKELNKIAPNSKVQDILTHGNIKKNVKKEIFNKSSPEDVILKWFFDVEISHRGDKTERFFFEQLLSMRKDPVLEDIVILPSAHFRTNIKNKMEQEFDILIFSWSRKLIIGIEIKRKLTNHTNVFKQLERYHFELEKRLGDQFGQGWSFFPVVCSGNQNYSVSNQHYITLDNTDIKPWLQGVLNKYPVLDCHAPLTHPLEQLKKILQIIVFTIHVSCKDQTQPITPSYWVDHVSSIIDSLSNKDNIVFYSNTQLPVLTSDDPKYKKLVIRGGYSTGKTFLLQEKAIMLSKDEEYKDRILYVVCSGNGLLYQDRKLLLEPQGIRVINNFEEDFNLAKEITDNGIKAVFLDEWNQNRPSLGEVDDTEVCWIALNAICQDKMNRSDYKFQNMFNGFESLQLSVNLRNTKEITKEAKTIAEQRLYEYAEGLSEPPSNFPNGLPPVYVNSIREAVSLARLTTNKGILVVTDDDISDVDLGVDSENVMFYTEPYIDENIENPCEFLRQDNRIVVTTPVHVNGFEWPIVIYKLSTKIDKYIEFHDCNLAMRCTTNLFVVNTKERDLNSNTQISNPSEEGDGLLLKTKRHIKNYVVDYLRFVNHRDKLENMRELSIYLVEALKYISTENIEVISENELLSISEELSLFGINDWLYPKLTNIISIPYSDSLSKEDLFLLIEDFLIIFIQDIAEKSRKLINWLVVPYTIHVLKEEFLKREGNMKNGKLLQDFHELTSKILNFRNGDVFKLLQKYPQDKRETFWKNMNQNELLLPKPELKLLEITVSDQLFTKMFKLNAIQYICDHIEHFQNQDLLLKLVPILKNTLKNISKTDTENLSKEQLFHLIKSFLTFIVQDFLEKERETIFNKDLVALITIVDIEKEFKDDVIGRLFPVFRELISKIRKPNLNHLFYLLKWYPKEKRNSFLKNLTFDESYLPKDLIPNFKILEISLSDQIFTKMFKLNVIQYVYDHIKHFNDQERLLKVVPILKETLETISKTDTENLSKEQLFHLIKCFLTFIVQDLVKKVPNDAWLVSLISIFEIEKEFKEDVIGRLFPVFRELKSKIRKPNLNHLFYLLEKYPEEERDLFLKNLTFDESYLPKDLVPNFKILEISFSDQIFTKVFKLNVIQYVYDHIKHFNDQEWLLELVPILKETLETISKTDTDYLSKEQLFHLIKCFLTFIVQDLLEKTIFNEDSVALISIFDPEKEFIDDVKGRSFPVFQELISKIRKSNLNHLFDSRKKRKIHF